MKTKTGWFLKEFWNVEFVYKVYFATFKPLFIYHDKIRFFEGIYNKTFLIILRSIGLKWEFDPFCRLKGRPFWMYMNSKGFYLKTLHKALDIGKAPGVKKREQAVRRGRVNRLVAPNMKTSSTNFMVMVIQIKKIVQVWKPNPRL